MKIRLRAYAPELLNILRAGYTKAQFAGDSVGGITVAIVALPLAMAFAIASGVGPEKGLITAIVAGIVASFFGGSRVQISGPTGAFVVVIYDIVMRFGYEGLAVATLMAGAFLVLMGIFKLGAVIKYIPYPVITGFTSGIALLIFSSQVADILGLGIENLPGAFLPKWQMIFLNLSKISFMTLLLGLVSIFTIVFVKRFSPKLPGHLIAVIVGVIAVSYLNFPVETIHSRFGDIEPSLTFASFNSSFSFETIKALLPSAFTIAILAAIESLLCAVVADGMMGTRHNANSELVGQGLANLGSIAFGGIPATAAIARTATNIKAGGKTPISGIIHSIVLAMFMFFLADFIVLIPLASLAAILIVVAWNMSEVENIKHILKAPTSDVAVLATTFLLTVLIDLTVAVQVGVVLAAILFIKRIMKVSEIINITESAYALPGDDPDGIDEKVVATGVEVYEVNGPFFFGVADKLKYILDSIGVLPKVFVLRMRHVPFVDATGMYALKEFYEKCRQSGTILVLSGVGPKLMKDLERFGFVKLVGKENVFSHIDTALWRANRLAKINKD
ncbi:MAG: sulfate permease [Sulfurospirillaceae bacterium]|nr:sulfate permease [Sulfurospirillaceae bacterium]